MDDLRVEVVRMADFDIMFVFDGEQMGQVFGRAHSSHKENCLLLSAYTPLSDTALLKNIPLAKHRVSPGFGLPAV
jgi:hypothetical protein